MPVVRLAVCVAMLALSACNTVPPCERLVSRLCGVAGPKACEQLKAKAPTDAASCQATLDDVEALNAQLDALVASTAAQALTPAAPPTKD